MKNFFELKEDILKLTGGVYCNYPSIKILIHPFSIRLVYFSARIGIHPNLLSSIGIIFSLLCLVFLFLGMYKLTFLFFWIRLVVDYSDGALARFTSKESKSGEILEFISDYGCYIGVWILITVQLPTYFLQYYFILSCLAYFLCVQYYVMPRLKYLSRRSKLKQYFLDHGIILGMGVFFELELWCLFFFAIGIAPEHLFFLIILCNLDLIYRIYEVLIFYENKSIS